MPVIRWNSQSPFVGFINGIEIVYSMEKENAVDFEVREEFVWRPGPVEVSREFWADEAVAAYRVGNIAPCPCRK